MTAPFLVLVGDGRDVRVPPRRGTVRALYVPAGLHALPDGTYTFCVRATDVAGNLDPTPATRTFTIDTTPPETTLTGPFSFTSESGCHV